MNMGKWKLLAVLQALAIYIIVRLDEGETAYNTLDSQLVSTVMVLPTLLPLSHSKLL